MDNSDPLQESEAKWYEQIIHNEYPRSMMNFAVTFHFPIQSVFLSRFPLLPLILYNILPTCPYVSGRQSALWRIYPLDLIGGVYKPIHFNTTELLILSMSLFLFQITWLLGRLNIDYMMNGG